MKNLRFVASTVAVCLLAAPLALGQGGNPPASTKESGETSGHGMTAAEQTGKAEANGTKSEEEKLIRLEKLDWEVAKKKDWKAYDRLLSSDFVWIDDSGVIAGRNEFLKYFAKLDLAGYAMDEAKVTFFTPNVALLTYKVTEKGSFNGQPLPSTPYYVGSGYVKRADEWVNVFTQTTSSR
jgi:hypothetical protein